MSRKFAYASLTALIATGALLCGTAQAQHLAYSAPVQSQIAPAHPEFDADVANEDAELDARLPRQAVSSPPPEAAGPITVATAPTHLYLVLGNGKAMRSASASAAKASPGRASSRCSARPSGRTGFRRPR